MGFEVPAAIGVQFADLKSTRLGDLRRRRLPDDHRRSWRLCVEYELPIKYAIINNGYLGMVRQWQEHVLQEQPLGCAHVPARLRASWPRPTACARMRVSDKDAGAVVHRGRRWRIPGPC